MVNALVQGILYVESVPGGQESDVDWRGLLNVYLIDECPDLQTTPKEMKRNAITSAIKHLPDVELWTKRLNTLKKEV